MQVALKRGSLQGAESSYPEASGLLNGGKRQQFIHRGLAWPPRDSVDSHGLGELRPCLSLSWGQGACGKSACGRLPLPRWLD